MQWSVEELPRKRRNVLRNEEVIRLAHIDESTFKALCDDELAEIERQRQRYMGTQTRLEIGGCTAIVIDDGIATGATMRAALRATRTRNPKKLVLAVPVAPTSTLDELRGEADDIVCLEDYEFFGATDAYARDFSQVSDEEVIDKLRMNQKLSRLISLSAAQQFLAQRWH